MLATAIGWLSKGAMQAKKKIPSVSIALI